MKEAEARLWLRQQQGDEAAEEFCIWPCNVEALSFFIDLADCWVQPPMGGVPVRIERGEMVATARLLGIDEPRWPALFRKLQAMQQTAIEVWRGR